MRFSDGVNSALAPNIQMQNEQIEHIVSMVGTVKDHAQVIGAEILEQASYSAAA